MKKILAAILLMMAASTSQAETDHETCTHISDLAEKVMEARLNDVKITHMMEVASESGPIEQIMSDMVIIAYESYGYKTDDYKLSAIRDFGAEYYIDCINKI